MAWLCQLQAWGQAGSQAHLWAQQPGPAPGRREAEAVGAEAGGEGPGLGWSSVPRVVAVLGSQVTPSCSGVWRQLPGASRLCLILLPAFPSSPPLLSLAPTRLCHLAEAGEQSHLLWEQRAAAGTLGSCTPAPPPAELDWVLRRAPSSEDGGGLRRRLCDTGSRLRPSRGQRLPSSSCGPGIGQSGV